MSKLETPKLWQQAENKGDRSIFNSISHFSDGHLLSKLLSPDNSDNPHKDSWSVSETKTNKRCRIATSHPWLKTGWWPCSPLPNFHLPLLEFCIFCCVSELLESTSSGQLLRALKDLHLFPILCCTGATLQPFSSPYSFFPVEAGTLACQI